MLDRRRSWLFIAAFWAFFGLLSGIQVWISMITHGHDFGRLVGHHLLLWEAWLLPTAAIVAVNRRWPVVPLRRQHLLVHLLAACVIAVAHAVYWRTLFYWMLPYDKMSAPPEKFTYGNAILATLPLEWMLYCLVLGSVLGIEFYGRYRERDLRAARLEASLADARLHALELQIQPHFLFNTMNAISALVRGRRNEQAVEMMAGLSELLRYSLDHAGEGRVPLEQELAILRRYLEIQHARFPDRMSFRIELPAETRRAAVPALLLQPLAENAVRHGIEASPEPGRVEIHAFRSDGLLRIDVVNTGRLPASPVQGIGLSNTVERLQHLYGDAARFALAEHEGGVRASVSIPWTEVA